MKLAKKVSLVGDFKLHLCFSLILPILEHLNDVFEKQIGVELWLSLREQFFSFLFLTVEVLDVFPCEFDEIGQQSLQQDDLFAFWTLHFGWINSQFADCIKDHSKLLRHFVLELLCALLQLIALCRSLLDFGLILLRFDLEGLVSHVDCNCLLLVVLDVLCLES